MSQHTPCATWGWRGEAAPPLRSPRRPSRPDRRSGTWTRLVPVAGTLAACRCYDGAGRPPPSEGGASRALGCGTFLTEDRPVTDGTLTKAALIEQVARVAGLTKRRAKIIIDTVFGNIAESLHRGEKVELRGFGSFRLRRRGPSTGRNPRTGDRVNVASKHVAYFTAGKELKEQINREPARTVPPPATEDP